MAISFTPQDVKTLCLSQTDNIIHAFPRTMKKVVSTTELKVSFSVSMSVRHFTPQASPSVQTTPLHGQTGLQTSSLTV